MPAAQSSSPSAAPARLRAAYAAADALLEGEVGGKGALEQPILLRRPFVFYLGHLPAFARNTARRAGAALPSHHFDDLFERGIDPDVEDPTKCHKNPGAPSAWPSWKAVVSYRDQVRSELAAAILPRATFDLIREHDFMHIETLYYMRAQGHRHPCRDVRSIHPCSSGPAGGLARKVTAALPPNWLTIPAGIAILGSTKSNAVSDGEGNHQFRWDNEFGTATVSVPSFDVAELPVTVAEYAAFVNAGGYGDAKFWDPSDWAWVQREGLSMPASWQKGPYGEEDSLCVVTVDGPVSLSSAATWPVSVSLAEARAYAKFRGARLPTESEWDRMAYGNALGNCDEAEEMVWGGNVAIPGVHGNFGMHARRPVPVGTFSEGKSALGVLDLVGNGWELVDTVFEALPGFEAMRLYPEYSADFFDGKHFVLKGASWATDASLVRRTFRNFYQAHYPYVFSKFRLVKSV